MKIIQTLCNVLDFQSRIIELDMDWREFKNKIIFALYDHKQIEDEELKITSYQLPTGILIRNVDESKVMKNDNFHLMIRTREKDTYFEDYTETIMFYLLEE